VPKVIEIGKYLFKLQLKMSGVFFWDTLYITQSDYWKMTETRKPSPERIPPSRITITQNLLISKIQIGCQSATLS